MVEVEWLNGSKDKIKLRDLKLEARKKSLDAVVSRITVLMVEGEQVAFDQKKRPIGQRISLKYWSGKTGGHGCRRLRRSLPAGTPIMR